MTFIQQTREAAEMQDNLRFFMWLGHDHHAAKREHLERQQRAVDEARAIALLCPTVEDDGE